MAEIPAFAILYGPRAIIGFAGIATIVAGTYKAENTFDELGVKAFENANAAGLEPVAYFDDVSDINKEELDAACPISWPTLTGWAILGFACLIPHHVGLGWFEIELSLPGMIGCMCCLCIGLIFVWPIREAYNERDFRVMANFYKFAAAFAVVLFGSVAASNYMEGPYWFGPLGGIFVATSLHRFWKNRKMGESWMRNGRPNWNYVVCSGGGPLYIFGWFLFWLAFSAIRGDDEWAIDSPQIPLYVSLRSFMACMSCFFIVLLTVVTEYVTDEHDDLQEGLGVVGRYCGRFSELFISLCFMASFGLYGASSFFPAETTIRKVFDAILVLLLLMQGRAYGLLFQKAIPNSEPNRWSRLGRIILIIFGFLVLFQVFTGWTSTIFSFVGTCLVVWGHKHTMDDRKKGKLYLDTGKQTLHPIVYSLGPVFYSMGWILLALAMSIPQTIWYS